MVDIVWRCQGRTQSLGPYCNHDSLTSNCRHMWLSPCPIIQRLQTRDHWLEAQRPHVTVGFFSILVCQPARSSQSELIQILGPTHSFLHSFEGH